MDSVISHHIDRLRKRLHNSRILTSSMFENIVEKLSNFESEAETLSDEEFFSKIPELFQEIQSLEPLKKVSQEHRDTYTHLARVNKECDKYLGQNLEDLNTHQGEKFDQDCLQQILSNCLISQGLLTQANLIGKTEGYQAEQISKIFETINHLKSNDLDAALASASQTGSSSKDVLFCIHKLKYLSLLKSSDLSQALEYAQKFLSQYAENHLEEIKHLMGACLFCKNPSESPYAGLFGEGYVQEVVKDILKEWGKCSDFPALNEIEVLLKAAEEAIPQIMPVAQISSKIWTNPLPAEIKLSQELKFHSTFVCPISKEVATVNNPPILLPCGHLIAKNTMDRLLSSSIRQKFKCPTCPTEVTEKETRQVYI